MMKKTTIFMFSIILISAFTLSAPVSASNDVEGDHSHNTYEYNYNGVKIISDVEKTESELKELYDSVVYQTTLYHEGTDFSRPITMDDPGDTTVMESPPVYRTSTNKTINLAKDAAIGYFTRYIPIALTSSFKVNFVGAFFLDITDIPDIYMGQWTSSYWSSAHNERRYEATLINYEGPYNGIQNIRVIDATHLYR